MRKRRLTACAALALALLGFGGCRGTPPPEGEVVSLSLGGGHMTRDSFYSFSLREKNGQVLFDASYLVADGDDIREVTLENAAAAQEDLDALRALCEEYGFAEKLWTRRKPKPGPFVADGPCVHFEITWEDGTRLYADTVFDGELALHDFFEALANRLQ